MNTLERAKEFAEDCDLYNEPVEAMAEFADQLITEKDARILRLEQALSRYADDMNWTCCEEHPLHNCRIHQCQMAMFETDDYEEGWKIAQQALKDIEPAKETENDR